MTTVAYALRCRICEHVESLGPAGACPRCDGPIDVAYDLDAVAAVVSPARVGDGPPSLWRYADLLPAVGGDGSPAGWTPLVRADSLSDALGLDVRLKLETANSTGSYKDRTAALAGGAAGELGFDTICCTSTGALGRAVAGEAAAHGREAIVIAPAGTGGGARALGAHVIELEGSWSECRRIERELSQLFPWAFVAGNLNAYAVEGAKTVAFEIAEQLEWSAPDAVVCPIGSGALLAKIAQGFHELRTVGLFGGGRPRLVGAQAGNASPVAAAFAADSAVAAGRRGFAELALGAARASGGAVVSVPDDEADANADDLGATMGAAVDRAGGAAVGALVAARRDGRIRAGERVVVVVSGTRVPDRVAPSTAAVPADLALVLAALGVA